MDERIRPGLKPDLKRDLRPFGLGLAAFLLLFTALAWRKGNPIWRWELAGAFLSATLALLRPAAFGPIYRVWMPVALFLGRVNTAVLMGVFYYLIMTPYALLLKALAGDLLDERLRDRDSYWKPAARRKDLTSYRRQF
ncbi:MAG: hypothetical protein HY549_09220 [Elusimicrobia bacterium]|nr:hypothetical protein [Elusimicrobiota bacterium]